MQCKIEDITYHIKESWHELTYAEYCNVVRCQDKPPIERLSLLTGIDIDTLNKCNSKQLSILFSAVSWMDEYEDVLLFTHSYVGTLNIGAQTYGQLEKAKVALQLAGDKPILAIGELINIYYSEQINNTSCVEAIGRGVWLLNEINIFLGKFTELYEYEPTVEEIEAGVDELSKLGSFYTVKKLSEKFCKHPDEVLKWEAVIVYSFLKAEAIDSKISRNLQNIYKRKSK